MDKETKQMFEMILKKLDNMDEKFSNMDEKISNMQVRQDEMFSVVKAIEHSNTTHKAEIDNIIYKVAHTEGTINKIGNVITESRLLK